MSDRNVRREFSRRISQIMNMVADSGLTRFDVLMLVARLTCVTAIGFFSMKWIMSQLDPTNSNKKRAKKKVFNYFVFFVTRYRDGILFSIYMQSPIAIFMR